MSTNGWSNELAIGVEAIDAEHARLLSLVERAETARTKGSLRSAVRLLRLFLGEFDRHFERELELLGGLDGAALAQRRSEYFTSQAVVQAHPLEADDVELLEHVTVYARAWLLDHIIRQDMPRRHAFPGKGAAAAVRRPLWRRSDFVQLRWRIALLAAVPLLALAFLVYTGVTQLRHQADSVDLLRQMNEMNGQVGLLVHELQRERGLASLYVADHRGGLSRLQAQIKRTDDAHGRFDLVAAALGSRLTSTRAKQVIDNAIVALDIVPEIRDDVMSGGFDGLESIDIYTSAIEDLNAVVPEVVRAILPSDFGTNTLAYMFLLEAKERAGQERAAGVAMLGGGARGSRPHKSLQELAAEEQAYVDGFLELAPPDLARLFQVARDAGGPEYHGLLTRLEDGETADTTAEEWFDVASQRMNAMNDVQSELIQRLATDVGTLQQNAYSRALWLGGGLGALLLLSVTMVLALGWTILPPLRRIGAVIQRLAKGERAVDVPGQEAGDELGAIARSVQSLKEELVHGDLLAARRWTENAERLRAVTDNLPGVVFRVHHNGVRAAMVTCVSRKLREVTGLAPGAVVDMPVRMLLRRLLRPEDWPVVLLALHRAGTQPLDFEFRLRETPNGRPRWMRVLATPTRTESGWVWDGVALDVSGLKRAEAEQARMNAELARVYRAQTTTQLTRGIGQELAALVQPLLAHGERAARSLGFADSAREDVLAVLAAGEKIRTLTERVADMGTGLDGERNPLDVVAVVGERIQAMRELLPGRSLDVRLDGAGTAVLSTRAEMERLVTHLCAYVSNVAGGEAGPLTVVTELADGDAQERGLRPGRRLVLRVGRTDRGGDGDLRVRPSGRFAARPEDKGSEFALAMARAIVDGSGGWLELRHSEGGVFVDVSLPVHDGGRNNVINLQGVSPWQKSRP